MIQIRDIQKYLLGTASVALIFGGVANLAVADEPCGDLEECKVIIEINASDGDVGFHVLFDAEGWVNAQIYDPSDSLIFDEIAHGILAMQGLTENFFESAEPFCESDIEMGEPFLTLEDFLLRFPAGDYDFSLDSGTRMGTTTFTHDIPAAPAEVDFNGHDITWEYGDDFGECVTLPTGFGPIGEGAIIGYEVVLEPDDDELGPFTFSVRVGPDVNKIRVPKAYLDSLEHNTPLKVEVGAIERRPNDSFGNTTFTEEDGFCNNPSQVACPEVEEEEEE